ncbi:uncharacterized protein METZ01_LOCUS458768 [marine metagenome]|uniref:Uncharacterized protein n=1 Tax=marine metagenome TaxID=408172 RepID=A0A383AE01_9ZZZZ
MGLAFNRTGVTGHAHEHRADMPAGSNQTAVYTAPGRFRIGVKGLVVVPLCERDYLYLAYLVMTKIFD